MKKLFFSLILGSLLVAGGSFAKEFGIRYDNNTHDVKVLPISVTYYLCTPAAGETVCGSQSITTTVSGAMLTTANNPPLAIKDPQASASTLVVVKHVDVYESMNSNTIVMSKDFMPEDCEANSYLDVAAYATYRSGQWIVQGIRCSNLG